MPAEAKVDYISNNRFCSIQLLRFVFCFLIVNYHFFSLYLRYNENLQNFFCRGYLGDEFFFMVSGFFLAQAAFNDREQRDWTLRYVLKRLKKIAIPYYSSWILCFIGCRIADILAGRDIRLIQNLLNSIYELLFIEMLGFTKGTYSNSVGWFFSGLIISIVIICPFLRRFKKNYILYAAPILGFLLLGMLCVHFDYLYYPHKILPELPILKGMVRAFSEVNIGVFIYGIYNLYYDKKLNSYIIKMLHVLECLLWLMVIAYLIFPFPSNAVEQPIQYDYIFTVLIFLALTITIIIEQRLQRKEKSKNLFEKLGLISVYVFFGQPIIYTLYERWPDIHVRTSVKYVLFLICVAFFSFLVYVIDWIFKKRLLKVQ